MRGKNYLPLDLVVKYVKPNCYNKMRGERIVQLDHKYIPIRCAANDPHRCQASVETGQCPFLAVPPTQYCVLHGNHTIRHEQQEALYQFNRTEMLHRLAKFRAHPDAINLTTELGILRLTLEALLNKCTDNYEFVTQSATITNLVQSIEKTLFTNLKLEKHMSSLLSLQQVIMMAQQFFNVVTQHIKDVDILDDIADEFEKIMLNPPDQQEDSK